MTTPIDDADGGRATWRRRGATTPKSSANATMSAAATSSGPADQRPDALGRAPPERAEAEPLADGAGGDVDHHDALQEGARHDRQRDGHEHEQEEAADGAGEDGVGVGRRRAVEPGERHREEAARAPRRSRPRETSCTTRPLPNVAAGLRRRVRNGAQSRVPKPSGRRGSRPGFGGGVQPPGAGGDAAAAGTPGRRASRPGGGRGGGYARRRRRWPGARQRRRVGRRASGGSVGVTPSADMPSAASAPFRPMPRRRVPATRDRTPACAPSGGVSQCSHISGAARHPPGARTGSGRGGAQQPYSALPGDSRPRTTTVDPLPSARVHGPRRKPNG